jgi:hypothetical protein
VQCGIYSPRLSAREQNISTRNEIGVRNRAKISAANDVRRESPGTDSLIFCSIQLRTHHLRGKF